MDRIADDLEKVLDQETRAFAIIWFMDTNLQGLKLQSGDIFTSQKEKSSSSLLNF